MCTLLLSAKPHASHRTDGFVPATFEVGHNPIWIPHKCSIIEGETADRTTPGERQYKKSFLQGEIILLLESAMLMLPEPQGVHQDFIIS